MKKILALLLCVAMLLGMASCQIGDKKEESDTDDSAVTSSVNADEIVMSTENFSMTFAELNYIFYKQYSQLINTYSYYAEQYSQDEATFIQNYLGLDIDSSLKDQYLPDASDTFFNYFVTSSKSEAQDILLFCEYAKENGIELSDDDNEQIESSIQSYEDSATESGLTLAEYFNDPTGLTTADVLRSYAQKNALAYAGYQHQQASHEYSEEEIDAEFNSDPKTYAFVSYLAYTIQPDDNNITDENVKEYADAIAATTDEASFKEAVKSFHENVLYADTTDAPAFYESTVEYKNISYSEDTDYLEWMFSNAVPGETYVTNDETTNSYTVYMLTSAPAENEYDKKNVRHILFLTSSYDSTEACLTKAEEVYALYQNDPTEEHFAELATQYSEDTSSSADGGLYENIDYNEMVSDFENWTFDESRQPGDTEIILNSYGYDIMYFVGNGDHVTEGHDAAKQALIDADYETDYAAFCEKYTITSQDDLINQIDA